MSNTSLKKIPAPTLHPDNPALLASYGLKSVSLLFTYFIVEALWIVSHFLFPFHFFCLFDLLLTLMWPLHLLFSPVLPHHSFATLFLMSCKPLHDKPYRRLSAFTLTDLWLSNCLGCEGSKGNLTEVSLCWIFGGDAFNSSNLVFK